MKDLSLIFILAFGAFTQSFALEIPADSCRNAETWTFFNGSEFKGPPEEYPQLEKDCVSPMTFPKAENMSGSIRVPRLLPRCRENSGQKFGRIRIVSSITVSPMRTAESFRRTEGCWKKIRRV